MAELKTVEIPISGMDCAECTLHVQHAIAALPGVQSVNVFLASEKASLRFDPVVLDLSAVRRAVESAGYHVPEVGLPKAETSAAADFGRRVGLLLAILFGVILFVVVVGEWLGLFERITERVPWPVGLVLVIAGGYPVFRNVIRAALKG
jgi:Cd2+/Zn2+-exporting ATPase/Cu+-exporting ATPase